MGNNSSQNKQKRLSAEINTKLLAAGVVCDRKSLRLNYMPLFRLALTKPLATNGADGIEDVISIMQSYLINRYAIMQLECKQSSCPLWNFYIFMFIASASFNLLQLALQLSTARGCRTH